MTAACAARCFVLAVLTTRRAAADCLTDPSLPTCVDYVYHEAAQDVDSLCGVRPGMVACELEKACGTDTRGYCHPFSLLGDICAPDKGAKGSMMGCHNYVTLCRQGSRVHECTRHGPVPNFVTFGEARDATIQMCSSMPGMQGCRSCTNRTDGCQAPLASLSKVCRGMPGMHSCAPIKNMCEDLANTPALTSTFCASLSSSPTTEFCTDATAMYMSGFVWGFDGNVCPVLLLPAWTLNTRLRYYVGLGLVVALGIGSEALSYLRRTTAAGGGALTCFGGAATTAVRLRQALDSMLHMLQICTGYCLMLVAMTYHIPLFACVLIGLGIGHFMFAHRQVGGQSGGLSGRPEPCCPDTGPIATQPGSIQESERGSIFETGRVDESLDTRLLRAPASAANTAVSLAAHVKLQVDGMTCNACVKRVQSALQTVGAIEFVDVSLGPPGRADIVCKDDLRDTDMSSVAEQAIAAIDGTGFSAHIALAGAE